MSKDSKTANRLVNETSTYLLQHAYNPVDWYPWSPEALDRSREEEKPILLSIGYSACHWCHVMEHESFEDAETAQLMNEEFVNIKVDREERTDLDEIYMKAVQLMTGHGGWPMTVFLTPELKPIFAGTYFPPDDRHGMPSFKKILTGVSRAWKEKRPDVLKSADEVTEHLRKFESMGDLKSAVDIPNNPDEGTFERKMLTEAFSRLYTHFDQVWGGIGSQPKFPQPFCLELAMRLLAAPDTDESSKKQAREFLTTSLDKMAFGGIHDHLGGGFARYSVDRKWLIPHFEKMLYDNALLSSIYFDAFRIEKNAYWLEVAEGILDFVNRELSTEDGAFYSSLDADSEGKEGEFYVWTPAQIRACLSEDDARLFMRAYGVVEGGNFEEGKSAVNILMSPEDLASDLEMTLQEFQKKSKEIRAILLAEREKRVRPGRDEKVLTSWNSLMISGFVAGYKATGSVAYKERAVKATRFIVDNLLKIESESEKKTLLRTWGRGKAKLNGYLDDYAYFVQALLDLAEIDPEPLWLELALELTESSFERFYDEEAGGFFYTEDDQEDLVLRPRSHFDGSVPSGSSVTVSNLLRLHKITDREKYLKVSGIVFGIYGDIMLNRPEQFANLLSALDRYLDSGREIVLVSTENSSASQEYLNKIHAGYRPNDVVVVSDATHKYGEELKLLEDRQPLNDKPTVYICENFACKEPVASLEKLAEVL